MTGIDDLLIVVNALNNKDRAALLRAAHLLAAMPGPDCDERTRLLLGYSLDDFDAVAAQAPSLGSTPGRQG